MNPTSMKVERRITRLLVRFVKSETGRRASHVLTDSKPTSVCFRFSMAIAIGCRIRVGVLKPIPHSVNHEPAMSKILRILRSRIISLLFTESHH